MSCSPPSVKQAELCAPINDLADSDFGEIFKWLPLYERLIVSEVCRRWHSISRKAWLDISKIDLNPIPGKHIGAVVNQCTNLQSVLAVNKTFDSNELTCLAKVASLKRVRFICCEFKLNPDKASIEQNIFSDTLENASWTEFIVHDARFLVPRLSADADACAIHMDIAFLFSVANLPASLTHLQLSGLHMCENFSSEPSISLDGLERLENLECFVYHWSPCYRRLPVGCSYAHDLVTPTSMNSEELTRLKNLKELCLGPALWLCDHWLLDLVSGLPTLEALFLAHVDGREIADELAMLMTSNSVLRVLVLSGAFWVDHPIELPARKRFPRGFGSDPLPLLHLFVGREASENIRFTTSASDAAIIHPINHPMPEFLEREDIAPIFYGVWVAEKIKEAAKRGGKLWNYEKSATASSIQHI